MTDSFDSRINNRNNENDKFEKESTNSYIDSKVGENVGSKNDRSVTIVPKIIVEKGSADEVITNNCRIYCN